MNTAPRKSKLGLFYEIYVRRLVREIDPGKVPAHIGVILDGNRRWAHAEDVPDVKGHQHGVLKIREVLEWYEAWLVRVVILRMLSIDNLQRDVTKLEPLQDTIGKTVQRLQRAGKYRLWVLGGTNLIDPKLAEILAAAHETELAEAMVVNIAVAYGGRQEIVAVVKEYLHEQVAAGRGLAQVEHEITLEDIEAHLHTKGQLDPDLMIRTSDKQCLSGLLLWQSANSESYFCETYRSSFRRTDFLWALRDYSPQERRNGKQISPYV